MSEKINTLTLEILSNSIAKLQQLGGTVDDDKLRSFVDIVMHHPKTSAGKEACDSDKSEPLDVSNTCEQLSSVIDALYDLMRACETKLRTLRAEMRAASRRCGIQTLPDEVLAHIFEEVAADTALEAAPYGLRMRVGETLGLVCRRFRSLSLALPSLWVYLSSDNMKTQRTKTYLERSKAAGLTIEVKIYDGCMDQTRFKTFLELVVQHSSRWKSFKYEQRDKHFHNKDVSRMIEFLSGLDFSSLERFDFYVHSDFDLRHTNLLGKWSMPKLHDLRLACKGVLPTPESPFFSSTSIRTLELEGKYIHLRDLGNFLVSLPNLVDLCLDLCPPWGKLPEDQVIFLPSLTHLEFKVSELKLFSDVLSGLTLPQAQKLRLEAIQGVETSVESWVKAIPLDMFSTVKDLDLTCGSMYPLDVDHSLDLRLIFERFPAVEHLKLEVPRCWCSDIDNVKPSPLRSLALTLSPGRDVEGCLGAVAYCENIETLEVACREWEIMMQYLSRSGLLVEHNNYDYRGRTKTIRWHKE